jgi:hypothetical protein
VMFRLQYRNFGGFQTLVTDHSVRANAASGVRWYVLRSTNGGTSWNVNQQGTYAPDDGKYRWMGSAALDRDGNLAVGYSISSAGIHPSVQYAGRLAGDPSGQLAQGERRAFTGRGSEKGPHNRWGDYSDLTVDPADDCTFYFTTEVYAKTNQYGWRTRIVSFKFPTCGP